MIANGSSKAFEGGYNQDTRLLRLCVYHLDEVKDAQEMWNFVKESFKGKTSRKGMVDLTQYKRTFVSKNVRKAFREQAEYFKTIDKAAFVINNPAIRMMVKVMVFAIDTRKRCRYFKTRNEALIWLKNENE